MTLRMVDASRYQVERADPLDLAKAKDAGYHIVNVALTGGRGYVSGSWAKTYLDRAAGLGMGRSTYHWLDGRTSGAEQARAQLARLRSLLGSALTGFAHFVDVEETGANGIAPPTWAHVRDYVTAMQQDLGRHVGIYGNDSYWVPRGWRGGELTPWLMEPVGSASPPADTSPSWAANWGGWTDRAVIQWGVQPLPGTGDCSLSVIRDHGVWADLTGGDILMPNADPGNAQPQAWAGPPVTGAIPAEVRRLGRLLNARYAPPPPAADDVADIVRWARHRGLDLPDVRPLLPLDPRGATETCAPVLVAEMDDWIAAGGTNLGCVGDRNHGTGFHRGANFVPASDYSRRRDPNGADGPFVNWNWSCASDFRHGGDPRLRDLGRVVLARLMAGAYPMICEFIGQPWPDRPVMYWSRWEGVLREYTGEGHDVWFHLSLIRSRADQRAYLWRDAVAITETELKNLLLKVLPDVLPKVLPDALAPYAVRAAIGNAVWLTDGVIPAPGGPAAGKNPDGSEVNTHWAGQSYMQNTYAEAAKARAAAQGLTQPTAALLAYAKAEAGEVPPSAAEIAAATVAALPTAGGGDTEQLAATLMALLGHDRAAAIADIWTGRAGQ